MLRHFISADPVVLDGNPPRGRQSRAAFGQINSALQEAGLAQNREASELGVRFVTVRSVELRHMVVPNDVTLA